MHHVTFGPNTGSYTTAILIKRPALVQRELEKHYLNGLDPDTTIGFSLDYGGKKKPTATIIKDYLKNLLPALDSLGITTVYCADGEYFKKLTKQTKAEPHIGYVLPCAIQDYEHLKIVYGVNYQSLFYSPTNKDKLDLSLDTLANHLKGTYKEIGTGIIHSESYPKTEEEIKRTLASLHQYDVLAADIEAFSLFFGSAGIGTIGFAWNQHEGTSFCCDYVDRENLNKIEALISQPVESEFLGEYLPNDSIRKELKHFFETYQGKLIWHNANYDLKVIVYTLWMDDYLDYEGLIEGMEVMCRHFDDTKLITYLATNSCAGNHLSLKEQAHEFAGNYAQSNISDIRGIGRSDLLKYNLVDCLSTWYVFNKHNPTLDKDDQREIYSNLFRPAVKQILQMELTGMPLHMDSVVKADVRMQRILSKYTTFLDNTLEDIGYYKLRRQEEVTLYNTTRKKKRKDESDFLDLRLNTGSPKQLQHLLYTYWGLPVIDKTDTKEPATGNKTLSKLLNHAKLSEQKQVIRCLIGISKVSKILTAFIPKFLAATPVKDGTHRLYGGFNLGGTVSGRLSSSNP